MDKNLSLARYAEMEQYSLRQKDQSQWISFPYELVHYDKDFHKIRSYTQNDGYARTSLSYAV